MRCTHRKSQVLALVVNLRQLAGLNGQETTKQQQRAVKGQQGVQKARRDTVAFVRDVLSARFQVNNDTFQVGVEDEPEQHHDSLDTDENSNRFEQRRIKNLAAQVS